MAKPRIRLTDINHKTKDKIDKIEDMNAKTEDMNNRTGDMNDEIEVRNDKTENKIDKTDKTDKVVDYIDIIGSWIKARFAKLAEVIDDIIIMNSIHVVNFYLLFTWWEHIYKTNRVS
ncbi:hypothetical protein RhiirA5_425286 [Rhizophagus irregularis]|nr:hypothetical protein RirG_218050 [Rhizophagus irregularis DAOM 197198w]PKC02411.1 hypothetical protein RhiirA5_425286 [Rhizophagus irregularis]GBC18950.2 hypothetical protein GLOIN_2v1778926 [Rhizophagus irregularis DAOM 181602=DAOM 197198]UZO22863.1 hypothetical protein OCT59_015212 [Rhizophagus irregularis]CAB4462714.1 unnamed protein product [Rhizophagus irregularis]